jgi:hypothetical protein
MPPIATPTQYLSDTIKRMQRQLDELQRSVGRPTTVLRDGSDNVLHMPSGQSAPTLAAKGQGVSLVMVNGNMVVSDEQGQATAPVIASGFTGPVTGDTYGTHHGDVGTPTDAGHNHYGDVHGNGYGFWYGPVGDGTTQNQINALNIYHTGAYGRVFGEVGQAGGPFYTTYGDVGNGSNFFNLFGTVHAPSERFLKTAIQEFDGGSIVDAVASDSWRWDPAVPHSDGQRHAGPMVDDIADHAPWLVRTPEDGADPRMLSDRDLVGVLWNALRDTRAQLAAVTSRVEELESRQGSS